MNDSEGGNVIIYFLSLFFFSLDFSFSLSLSRFLLSNIYFIFSGESMKSWVKISWLRTIIDCLWIVINKKFSLFRIVQKNKRCLFGY